MTKDTVSLPLTHRSLVIAILAVCCFGIAGCSTVESFLANDKEDKQLFKSRDQYVRIVKQDSLKGVKTPPNEHPVSLDTDQIRRVLALLEITLPKQEKPSLVFNDPELDNLSKYLSQGLAAAGPEEDVIFAVVGDFRAVYGLAKEPKFTSGRVFYREGKLNIIFGKIQEEYKSYGLHAPVDRRLYPMSPGSRSVRSEHIWKLLGYAYQDFYTGPDGERTDWLVIDLAAMAARAAMGEKETATMPPHAKTVEERLSILNDLRNRKVITEEEYQMKRTSILNEL